MKKAFELAERLGIPAFELMDRMTVTELRLWSEYDATNITKDDYQVAAILAKLDWIKGVRKPDMSKYLPKPPGKKRGSKTLAQMQSMIFGIAAQSRGTINGRV